MTTLGRAVAILTMFSGIGVFGAFTALIGSFLVRPREDHVVLEKMEARLDEIEHSLRLLSGNITTITPPESDQSGLIHRGKVVWRKVGRSPE